jgi:arylsulfatase
MATCVDLAGAEYPTEFAGHKITPLEGKSLVPAITGNKAIVRDAIYWEHEGNKAIFAAPWKLVSKWPGPWELYNLEDDRTEANDLATKEPERVKELAAKWQAWAERANVLPLRPYAKGNGANKSTKASPKREFKLADGDKLTDESAPDVGGRSLSIVAELGDKIGDGVIIAHGGTNHGYSLFVKENHLAFAVRLGGKLSTVKASAPMGSGPGTVSASLAKDGSVVVEWKNMKVAEGKVASALKATPKEGMQVGQDYGAAVADYTVPFRYGGEIRSVVLKLSD